MKKDNVNDKNRFKLTDRSSSNIDKISIVDMNKNYTQTKGDVEANANANKNGNFYSFNSDKDDVNYLSTDFYNITSSTPISSRDIFSKRFGNDSFTITNTNPNLNDNELIIKNNATKYFSPLQKSLGIKKSVNKNQSQLSLHSFTNNSKFYEDIEIKTLNKNDKYSNNECQSSYNKSNIVGDWNEISKSKISDLMNKNQCLQEKLKSQTLEFNKIKRDLEFKIDDFELKYNQLNEFFEFKLEQIKEEERIKQNLIQKQFNDEIINLQKLLQEKEKIINDLMAENSNLIDKYSFQKNNFNNQISEIEILINYREKEFEKEFKKLSLDFEDCERKTEKKFSDEISNLKNENETLLDSLNKLRVEFKNERTSLNDKNIKLEDDIAKLMR